MTNIWTNTFEEIRKPHFEMEDPYTSLQEKKEGKAKRWWDDDGDGVGYEEGEVEGKFQKKKKVKEEVEQIDELSHDTYRSVAKAQSAKVGALQDAGNHGAADKAQDRLDRTKRLRKKSFVGPKAPGARNPYAEEYVGEETLYTSKSSQEKIDVMKSGKKNKINISPEVKEEVEAWVGELVEEGYDLSEFTWDEITNIYLDEAGTSAMPPKGDYQTTMGTATEKQDPNASLTAAKAKAAKAKVSKEIADLQVAKQSQRLKVNTNEAVIQYLAHRPDVFENLEEGVYDPKKSKMRPASERSKRTMTDAQRKAEKKEAERVAKIHSKGETVLTGLTKPQRRSSQPMGSSQPSKSAAPEANRKVSGKYDQLAKKASSILKSIKN
jgi:hypothetical protein